MRAELELALGKGHVGASVALDRGGQDRVRVNWWLVAVAALLTIPFVVALTVRSIGYGRGLALGPPLALVILAVARVRVHAGRRDGRWVGGITARLTAWETAIALLALAVVVVFFGHLVADSWACANGVRTAC